MTTDRHMNYIVVERTASQIFYSIILGYFLFVIQLMSKQVELLAAIQDYYWILKFGTLFLVYTAKDIQHEVSNDLRFSPLDCQFNFVLV